MTPPAPRNRVRRGTRKHLIAGLTAAALATVVGARPASAGLVSPGETLTVHSGNFAHPGGTILATRSIPFTLHYQGGGAFVDFPGVVNAYFENAVVRNDASGKLGFVYGVVYEEGMSAVGTGAGSELWAGRFGSFLTDASGVVAFDAASQVSRSQDGSIVGLLGGADGGMGAAPLLVVMTDATSFNANGIATFRAADTLLVAGDAGKTHDERVSAEAIINGAFQPGAAPTNAVPLPPAVFTGLGVMGACGILRLGRRYWAAVTRA